ncbi:MAG: hypothetical protein ACTHK5_07455 [Tsuneonella sp.]
MPMLPLMRRTANAGLCSLLILVSSEPGLARERPIPSPTANPSEVIATELAFARSAQDKGQWTAFRDFAAKDAVWANPGFSLVQGDLKGRADPAKAIAWEPDRVWSSCDGSYAITSGPAIHASGAKSRFLTVWQRQSNGDYRWVLDQGFDLEDGYNAPEMIGAEAADCSALEQRRMVRKLPKARRGEAWQSGRSDDGTLTWTTQLAADCTRHVTVTLRRASGAETVFERTATAEAAPGQPAPACTPTA